MQVKMPSFMTPLAPQHAPATARPGALAPSPKAHEGGGPSFGDTLTTAVNALGAMEVRADDAATRLAHGAGNLHEVALAMEQADISMRLAMKVRNKVVEAYQDIMRMGV